MRERRNKQCASCPFRGASEDYRKEAAIIPAEDWTCHTERPFGGEGPQCRGHYEAQRKYPPTADQVAALMRWREDHKNDFAAPSETESR